MTKCPLCSKDKTEYEMRPLINVAELKMGEAMTEEKSEREIGGAKLQIVCRGCWQHILENKEKGEVIEMMETLCGLLFEVDRRQREQASSALSDIIEKARSPLRKITMIPSPNALPSPVVPQYEEDDNSHFPIVAPLTPHPLAPSWPSPNTGLPSPWFQPKHWVVGQHSITYGDIHKLGDDWNTLMSCNASNR